MKDRKVANDRSQVAARFGVKCITEWRDLGQGFAMVSQSPADLPIEIIQNTSNRMAHYTKEEGDRDILAGSMMLDGIDRDGLGRLGQGEFYGDHPHLYRPILAKSSNPFAGVERPSEKEVHALIREQPWYRELSETRLAMACSALDEILRDVKNMCAFTVKLGRRPADREHFVNVLPKTRKAVIKTERLIEDILGAVNLDGGLNQLSDELATTYRSRLKDLADAYSDYINREIEHGNGTQKQKRMAGITA